MKPTFPESFDSFHAKKQPPLLLPPPPPQQQPQKVRIFFSVNLDFPNAVCKTIQLYLERDTE